ncbi:MAG TPA: hypothetical protein VF476_13445 [Chitinophagaceae bacterium]
MADLPEPLEHQILDILYTKTSFYISGHNEAGKTIPLYKRSYESSYLNFGTLVDILNNPGKYTWDIIKGERQTELNWLQKKVTFREEIVISKYSFVQVSEALEILVQNDHVKDDSNLNVFNPSGYRCIQLKLEGAIAFRNEFYLKKKLRESLEVSVPKSTINTNNWMIGLTIIIALSTIIDLVCDASNCTVKTDKSKQQYSPTQQKQPQRSL